MREKLLEFVLGNGLSPISFSKSLIKKSEGIYRTKDARAVHTRVLSKLSGGFVFSEPAIVCNCFGVDFDSGLISVPPLYH